MLVNASRPLHNDLRAGNVWTKLKRSRPSLICNRAADVRRNPIGLEAGGPSRAGFFLACMEMNGKEDIDESDEAKGMERKQSCT